MSDLHSAATSHNSDSDSDKKVRLKAVDVEDLAIISAFLQDARIPLREMAFVPDEGRFYGLFTRYTRELLEDPTSCDGLQECQSALVFAGIRSVKHRNLDAEQPDRELNLLTIATEPGQDDLIYVELVFEGDVHIQLRTDRIDARLQDVSDRTVARVTPCDHFAQMSYDDMADDSAQA